MQSNIYVYICIYGYICINSGLMDYISQKVAAYGQFFLVFLRFHFCPQSASQATGLDQTAVTKQRARSNQDQTAVTGH